LGTREIRMVSKAGLFFFVLNYSDFI